MKQVSKVWLGLALCGAFGCSDQEPERLPDVLSGRTRAVENGLLFLDESESQGYLLDITQKDPSVKLVDLPEGEKTARQRPGQAQDEVVLLTSGQAAVRGAGENEPEIEAHLVVVDKTGEKARYPLGSRFGSFVLSDDGRYAVAYAPAAGFAFGTSIAVVDLTVQPRPGENPRLLNVTSLDGQVPARFVFSPATEKRRFLVTLANDYVNLIDLEHLERGEVTIPLTLPDSGESLFPNDLVFAGDQIYIQSAGARDVLVVQLTETPLDVNSHGFEVSLRSLPAGAYLRGIAMVGSGDTQRLLALSDAGARVIDPLTGTGLDLQLTGVYDEALPFTASSPSDAKPGLRVLLYGTEARLAFLDVSETGDITSGDEEELPLPRGVAGAFPLLENKQLVLTHETDQVSLVDLQERTVSPLSLGTNVASTYLDAERSRLWITTSDGSLGTVDLQSLLPSQILLEGLSRELVLVRGETPRMVVVHASESGFVTLLDADKPSLNGAESLLGFFWNGVL